MDCIKTGFHGFVEQYHEYVYGDAFSDQDGNYHFRICERSFKPIQPVLHFIINDVDYWWDEEKTSQLQNSTMFCMTWGASNYGYDGKLLP